MSFDDWQQHSMGDVVNVTQGLAINAKTKHLFRESGAPLLRISDLFSGNYAQFISEEDAPKQCIATKDEIIYTRTGQVGFVFTNKVGVVHNNCFKVTPKDKSLSPRFLYWFLYQSSIRELANTIASGSVQKDLTHSAFKTIKIKIPKLQTQEHIASILSALDNRISLLRETNTTLEAIAQTLFKSWFVDFDPVKAKAEGRLPEGMDEATAALFPSEFEGSALGLIPKGWRVGTLGDMMKNESSTFNFSGVEKVIFINTGDVSDGQFLHCDFSAVDTLKGQAKKAIRENDVLFSEIRPKNKRFAYVNFDPTNYVVSTKFMVLRSSHGIHPRYIYQVLRQPEIIETFNVIADSRSGTFPQITFDAIKAVKVVIPSNECINRYIDYVSAIFQKVDLNFEQQKELKDILDTLLPRLISGQLRLNQTQEIMDEVTA